MLYVVETKKPFDVAVRDLEDAVKRNRFGVLHIHDLKETLKEKGIALPQRLQDPGGVQSAASDRGPEA